MKFLVAVSLTTCVLFGLARSEPCDAVFQRYAQGDFQAEDQEGDKEIGFWKSVELVKNYDVNMDGIITKQEYLEHTQEMFPPTVPVIEQAELEMDKNKDGILTAMEVLLYVGGEDENGDGHTTRAEYFKFWKNFYDRVYHAANIRPEECTDSGTA